jgi:hypothetical protein
MKINYLYRRGRIVTVTWSHGGEICKVLARPGQFVYDTITENMYTLKEDEYVLSNALWDKQAEYIVPQPTTQPKLGFRVHVQHLVASTVYEKKLRRIGILLSPNYNSIQPQGSKDELIVRRLSFSIIPKVLSIISADYDNDSPVFELSNGTYIPNAILKHLYRKPIDYEIKRYNKETHSTQLLVLQG